MLCTGKVYYDLYEEREKRGIDDIYLLRVEQLYPVPLEGAGPRTWPLQEGGVHVVPGGAAQHGRVSFLEPSSNGCSTSSARPSKKPTYAGRPASASTAVGQMSKHLAQLKTFLDEALA